ncbi:MAG: SCP2 sterol-binding domain-containing protein [Endozoicomonadaceae bacterium]|nr:SCP2 sterol-binding domain-containing protein [Endozoicomonadaceae bacterium]
MADEHLKQLVSKHFNSQAAANVNAIYQLNLKDGDDYFLKIDNGNFEIGDSSICLYSVIFNTIKIDNGNNEIGDGSIDEPTVTLTTDKKTLEGVIDGSINGMQAFMMGKLKFSGNMGLAMKLKDIFSSA